MSGSLPPDVPERIGAWVQVSRGIDEAVWDEMNRVKDRRDEELDAMRCSNGMTLDQYLESVTR